MTLFRVFRGTRDGGGLHDYQVAATEGMVVLDAVHAIQAEQAPDLAVRWNCKAGKCGSCSAEINGRPKLMCMTRMSDYAPDETITVTPMKAFPVIKDLVTDVSWNYEVNKRIPSFQPRAPDFPDGTWRMYQYVLRTHEKHDQFMGHAMLVRAAVCEMHPLDDAYRRDYLRHEGGIGFCNITKCCTEVCPESITITDNAIIPLKERVVDANYDPLAALWRKLTG